MADTITLTGTLLPSFTGGRFNLDEVREMTRRSAELHAAFGWQHEGLVDKGRFTVGGYFGSEARNSLA
jgi:phage protein U